MKKTLILIFSLFCFYSFGQSNLKIVEFYNVQNAQYGYSYILPTAIGKEIIGKSKDYELTIYNSSTGNYQINIFSEKYFEFNEKVDELNKYFEQVKKGKHIELKNAEIISYEINVEKNMFIIHGKKESRNFIWKSIIIEIPISGEFGFNTMIFYYKNTTKNKKLGQKLIEEFREY